MTGVEKEQEAGLLNQVLAYPEDDTPRLVYADWLEEHGQTERAEFIRTQCRIAELEAKCLCGGCVRKRGGGQHHNGPCSVDQERIELPDGRSKQAFLRLRERELLGADDTSKPLIRRNDYLWGPECLRGLFTRWEFRRGFVEAVTCRVQDWAGRPCEVCNGYDNNTARRRQCRLCGGTGRLNARGQRAVRAAPIREVWLSDQWPWNASNRRWGWTVSQDDFPEISWYVPTEIWGLLPYTDDHLPSSQHRRWYRTEEEAVAALSEAALAWARQEECPDCTGIGHGPYLRECPACKSRGTVDFREVIRKRSTSRAGS